MSTMRYSTKTIIKNTLRTIFNESRLCLIYANRLLFDWPRPKLNRGKSLVILNLQYINAFSEVELLMGMGLIKKGYDVKAVICPGLDYCERMDYQTDRPKCDTCRAESKRYCKAYGIRILEPHPSENTKNYEYKEYSKFPRTSKVEYIHRNYIHYFKSYSSYDPVIWKKIENSISEFASYILNLDFNRENLKRVITANGRFFQTGLPIELLAPSEGFISTEAFGLDTTIILGNNTFALNQDLEMSVDDLRQTHLDKDLVSEFLNLKGEYEQEGFNLWKLGREDNVEKVKKDLDAYGYKKIISYFPNVVWDSVYMGLGFFNYSPSTFIKTIHKYALKYKDLLFVVRAHPGEVNVPQQFRVTGSIFEDLAVRHLEALPNLKYIEAESKLSSYAIAAFSDEIIVWNSTFGLEMLAAGRKVACVAEGYYSKFGLTKNITSEKEFEKILKAKKLGQQKILSDAVLAQKIIHIARFNRRFFSPIHIGTKCKKFLWWSIYRREKIFIENFPNYFEGQINTHEFGKLLNS